MCISGKACLFTPVAVSLSIEGPGTNNITVLISIDFKYVVDVVVY